MYIFKSKCKKNYSSTQQQQKRKEKKKKYKTIIIISLGKFWGKRRLTMKRILENYHDNNMQDGFEEQKMYGKETN